MRQYTITTAAAIEADSAEEAALLHYQELANGHGPIEFSITDDLGTTSKVFLDRTKAEEFATIDHTADPGNW